MATKENSILTTALHQEVENRFLTYALSTIVARSLPDVRDGLKPVHRRILYAMWEMGLGPTAKFRKSAAVVGEVLGKFHPHGDQAAYDAMVRMAQDFSLRYPLVEGSGNFGSLDGDPAAAMRYTEARLSQLAEELLVEIEKETVGFRPNYDNSLKEPMVLPARFPQLLVNGTSGIAVGMSCSFPPHNLGEVIDGLAAMIDNSNIDLKDLLKLIKGPDFPTAGQILNSKKELKEIYQTGSGAIRVRGEYAIEDLPRGKQAIVFTSIPYQVNKAKLLEKLIGLMDEKKLPQVTAVRDESTDVVRVVIELKQETNPELVTAYLFKHTDLESNFPVNFTALKPSMEPERLSLKEVMQYFLDFRFEIVTKRLNYDLRILKARLHILLAFEKLYDDLDTAIKLIRKSKSREEAGEKIKKHFKFDDEQTKAILEMQLYKLAGLEIERILKEKAEKTKLKKDIEAILGSQKKVWGLIKTELLEIKEKYGDKRRSVMKAAEDVEFSQEDFIVHEDVTVIMTKMGWIRRVKTVGENLRFKEGDDLLALLPANTKDNIAVFSSAGKVYVIKAFDLPSGSGFGEPVQHLFKFGDGERPITAMNFAAVLGSAASAGETEGEKQPELALAGGTRIALTVSSKGMGFKFDLSQYNSVTTRAGKKFAGVKEGDSILGVDMLDQPLVLFLTTEGKAVVVAEKDIPLLTGAGKGVKLVNVKNGDVALFRSVKKGDQVRVIDDKGKEKTLELKNFGVMTRGSVGLKAVKAVRFV
ncbi:MAG: DNA topoisomerase IV subunit A [Nitrospiraceae bacterium]|nr:DNA topoisomerase IV subunit A [Nitrospiraceae bacterium]